MRNSEGGQRQWGDYKRNAMNPRFLHFLLFSLPKTRKTETGDGQRRKRNREQAFFLCLYGRSLPEIKLLEVLGNEKKGESLQTTEGWACLSVGDTGWLANIATNIGWMCLTNNRLKGLHFTSLTLLPHE